MDYQYPDESTLCGNIEATFQNKQLKLGYKWIPRMDDDSKDQFLLR